MSLNKTDIVNTLCIAHQITKYEPPPKDRFIVLKYTHKELKIMASVVIKVDKFDLVEQGATYTGVCFALKPGKESLCVKLRSTGNFANPFKFEDYTQGFPFVKNVMIQDYLYFDNNMRVITRIPMIEGWNQMIVYINYCNELSAKRKRAE